MQETRYDCEIDSITVAREEVVMETSCQRCFKSLQPPFWMCLAGHPLCHQCSREAQGCPACQASDSTASLAMQGMQHLACRFNYRKCSFIGTFEELQKHEVACPYGDSTFPCFLLNCEWNGVKAAFCQHLTEDHKMDPPVSFRTGFIYDVHTAAPSLEDWKGKEWTGLFTQNSKKYLFTCSCADEVLAVCVFSLSHESEPVQITVRSPVQVGVEQSPVQVFIGRTMNVQNRELRGLTVDLDQLGSFMQHEFRKVGATSCCVALVSITVLLGDSASESLYRL